MGACDNMTLGTFVLETFCVNTDCALINLNKVRQAGARVLDFL